MLRYDATHDADSGREGTQMRFGVTVDFNDQPVTSPEFLAGFAQAAEEFGFDTLWTSDHVVIPQGHNSVYPYAERMPYEDAPLPDPLITLAFVAASTKTLRLGTSVLVLPQRNPVVLAKQLATLDVLSEGRVDLGIGIGWLREEFEALGVPWERRGKRTDEYIEAMRALWTQPVASYEGELVRFSNVVCDPKPVQPGGVPFIIGGHSIPAARRAGRLGNGFFPHVFGRAWFELIEEMRRTAEAAGRDPSEIEISAGVPPDLELAQRLEELGVSRLNLLMTDPDVPSARRTLERISRDLIARM